MLLTRKCAACRHCWWLLHLDWLLRFWRYFTTVPDAVAWLSCAGFVFGVWLDAFQSLAQHHS